ncbi:MAG TPA: O-antigen ligase family protein [Chloroflexota bacterium]|nr:O-antigen ligase family protein [Chloroflexota bacterium]
MLLVTLVTLPALVNPLGAAAFEPLKSSFVRVAAALAGCAWLGYRTRRGDRWITRAAIAFVASVTVSTVLSSQPLLSVFGSLSRGMGWLTVLAGLVLMLVGADLWTEPRRRERAVNAMLLGAAVPCAYVVVQRLGRDPINWDALGAPGSTLASPTFLAGYLVILAPLALYRVVDRARQAQSGGWGSSVRYAGWLGLLLVIGGAIAQSTIRGALLGLVAGTLTFALLVGRSSKAALAGALMFLALAVALAVSLTGAAGVLGIARFLRIGGSIDSSSERLTVWRDALTLPLPDGLRALIGFGPEMQAAVLEHGESTVRLTQNQQWDRAHNLVLDTWLTGGLVGIAALLALLVVTVVTLVRKRRELLAAAVLGALVGHLVDVSFAFQTVVSGTLFWVVLGLAASFRTPSATPRRALNTWLAISLGAMCLALLPLLAAPAIGDAIYGAGRRALQRGDFRTAAALDESAAHWLGWLEEPIRAAGLAWLQVATRRADDNAASNAERDLVEAVRRGAALPTPHVRLLRMYLSRDRLTDAEAACQQALAAGPFRATAWEACADVSSRAGRTDEARERRDRANSLRQPIR